MRTTLNEIEKFYIHYNYQTMKLETFLEKITDVDPQTVRAYVLNMPSPNKPDDLPPQKPPEPKQEKKSEDKLPEHTKNETIEQRQDKLRQTTLQTGKFFEKRSGAVMMTPTASELSDVKTTSKTSVHKHITTLQG